MYVIKNDTSSKCVWKTKKLSNSIKNLIRKNSNSLKVKQANDIEEVEEHNVWDVLNNVNENLSWNDLVKMIIQYLSLIGNAFLAIEKSGRVPIGIKVLPAEYTSVMLNQDTMSIVGYRVYNGVREHLYKKEEVIHFKRIAAGMFWRIQSGELITGTYGMGALESILSEVMCSNAILDYERALMENQCIPAGIVNYAEGKLTPDQIKAAEASWKKAVGGIRRAGTVKVTDQSWTFTPLQINPKDLSYENGRKWLRETICNAMGVPVGLISPTESNRATSLTDMHNFMAFTIAPMCSLISEQLNHHLIPQFDDNLFVEFENAVKEDDEMLLNNTEMKLKYNLITINEWRAGEGLEPVPWGDEPIKQAPVDATPDDGDKTTEDKTQAENMEEEE
jgi:HK97 family phage portal protein